MTNPTPMPDQVEKFRDALTTPRAAFAYGLDTRELRHNAFLDFLLSPSVPATFSRKLVTGFAAVGCERITENQTDFERLAQADLVDIKGWCNTVRKKKRPDEIIHCRTAKGEELRVVIEMKIKAKGGESQLDGYVKTEAANLPQATLLGMLLRIPGRDQQDPQQYPLLNGSDYRSCIENALTATDSGDWDPKARWLVEDYLATLDFLDLMDTTIVQCGEWLNDYKNSGNNDLLQSWLQENWRWVCVRIMREVVLRCSKTLPGWTGGAYGSKGNAAADIEPNQHKLEVCDGDDGASLYAHWNLGKGFEIRAIVNDYHGSPTAASQQLMVKLADKARMAIKPIWQGKPTKYTGRTGNSCSVGRLVNSTCDVEEIVTSITDEIRRLEPVLRDTVEALR